MDKNALNKIVHLLMVLGAILSQAMMPAAAEVNLDESVDEALLVNPPRQHADWENILREAFRLLGWDDFRLLVAVEEGYVASHAIPGTPLVVNLTIQTKSGTKEWSEMPNLSIGETKFHSHDAYTMTLRDVWGNVSGHSLEWEMNGLYYLVGKGSSKVGGYSGTLDELYDYAEALYSAATGTTLQKGGACAEVTCSADHCGEDGITLYYDCSCDPADGECYCFTKICSAGCDNQAGACRAEQTVDLCANVTCEPSCEDNVSFSEGVCDPQTGACLYAQTQDCGLAGCNEDNGLCNNLSDLSVDKITVIQAVEGGKLAARKPTAVVVAFNWPDETRDAEVNVSLFIDGRGFQALRHTVKNTYSQDELLSGKHLVVFHLPQGYINEGNRLFQVETIIADEEIVDPDISNNAKSAEHAFTATRSIRLLFAAHPSISETDIWRFYAKARPLLLDVFPVQDVTIVPTFYTLQPDAFRQDQIALLEALRGVYNSIPGQYADYAVGLFPDGFFGEGTMGMSYFWARRSVLVGDGSKNRNAHHALPHELAHELFGDEYSGIISNMLGANSPGKWLPKGAMIYKGQQERVEILAHDQTYINFMGEAGSGIRVWVDQNTWDTLLQRFSDMQTGLYVNKVWARPLLEGQAKGSGFVVSGFISADNQVDGVVVRAMECVPGEKSYESKYWLEAYDRENYIINRVPVELDMESGAPYYFYSEIVTDLNRTRLLKIVQQDQTIWQSSPSANAPTVSFNPIAGGEMLKGIIPVSWDAQDKDGDALTYSLLYSPDSGESWLPLATGLITNAFNVNTDRLPGCERCLLRVIASDGWHSTATSTQNEFRVEKKLPQVIIESPMEGQEYEAVSAIELSAFAFDWETGWIEGQNISWNSSLDGDLGCGNYVSAENFTAGTHVISAVAADDQNNEALAQVMITVRPTPDQMPADSGGIYGFLAVVMFVLAAGAVVLLVMMKRKGKKNLVILSAILLGVFGLCFLAALVLALFGGAAPQTEGNEKEDVELEVADAPSLQIQPEKPAPEITGEAPIAAEPGTDQSNTFSDNFSKQRGWAELTETRFSAGLAEGEIYRIEFWQAGDTVPVIVLQPMENELIGGDMVVKVTGDGMNTDGAYGLVCRANGDDLYGFHVANDGRYWLYKAVGGKVTTLDSGRHAAISEEFNQVEMRCIGSRITSLVNGTQVSQVEDADLKSGNAGLFAQPLGGPIVGAWSFYAVFDDFYAEFSAGEGRG